MSADHPPLPPRDGMSARETVLASVRRALGVKGNEAPRRAEVDQRIAAHPRGVMPTRGQLAPAARLDMFVSMALAASASLVRVPSSADVPSAIAAYLRERNLPLRILRGSDARLAALGWDREPNLDVWIGPSDGLQPVGLSHAFGAVAETGTLVMLSGPDNPTTLNFLPDHHLVVLEARDIAADYESVWDRIRAAYGAGALPRTVNWITGPSRSADIEQTLLLGAHGPRSLHILLVGEPA